MAFHITVWLPIGGSKGNNILELAQNPFSCYPLQLLIPGGRQGLHVSSLTVHLAPACFWVNVSQQNQVRCATSRPTIVQRTTPEKLGFQRIHGPMGPDFDLAESTRPPWNFELYFLGSPYGTFLAQVMSIEFPSIHGSLKINWACP